MRTVRLAVLLCDEIITSSPDIVTTHGNYAQIYREFLSSSLKLITSEVTFSLDAYDVVDDMAYPPDDAHYDGILISGSFHTPPDPRIPWVLKLITYVKHVLTEKPSLKIFGICFGHQIVAEALGSSVEKGEMEVSVTTVDLTDMGKAIFHADQLNLQLFHQRHVVQTPPRAHRLGWSAAVTNQGFVIFHRGRAPLPKYVDSESNALRVSLRSIQVLTLQGHPELTEPIMRILITKSGLPDDLVEDALKRVGNPTDGLDKVGKVIWSVLGVTAEC